MNFDNDKTGAFCGYIYEQKFCILKELYELMITFSPIHQDKRKYSIHVLSVEMNMNISPVQIA